MVILGLIALLMILQPDMGTLTIIALSSLVVYFIGGGKLKHVAGLILLGLAALIIMINIYPYQANRFKCMLDPSYSPKEYCYQINQSLIAIGSGGFGGGDLALPGRNFCICPKRKTIQFFPSSAKKPVLFFQQA